MALAFLLAVCQQGPVAKAMAKGSKKTVTKPQQQMSRPVVRLDSSKKKPSAFLNKRIRKSEMTFQVWRTKFSRQFAKNFCSPQGQYYQCYKKIPADCLAKIENTSRYCLSQVRLPSSTKISDRVQGPRLSLRTSRCVFQTLNANGKPYLEKSRCTKR